MFYAMTYRRDHIVMESILIEIHKLKYYTPFGINEPEMDTALQYVNASVVSGSFSRSPAHYVAAWLLFTG